MAAPTHSLFLATPEDLARLTSEQAVQTIASLLWSEAFRLQIAVSDINIPTATTTSDGGIDAEVKNTKSGSLGLGIIKSGLTTYQIKTGKFSLRSETDIRSLLLSPKSRRKAKAKLTPNDLLPRIRSCLDKKATLVAVLFGSDNPDPKDNKTAKAIKSFLGDLDAAYKSASIEVWRQNQLIGFLQHFPALLLRIKGVVPDAFAVSHDEWFAQGGFDGTFVQNKETSTALKNIRDALLKSASKSVHVRFVGEPGIGKSRLIYEVTNHDSLRSLVVYAKDTEQFLASAFFQRLVSDADKLNLILVADECSPTARGDLRIRLRNMRANIRVVSIYNEEEEGDKSAEFQYFEAPRLDDDRISEIIQEYNIPPEDARYWAPECGGSPRTAHVVGQNLSAHADVLRGDGLVRIWDRYIAGTDDPNSDTVKRRQFVLSCLALFRRVGWHEEAREVFEKIVKPIDSTLSYREFVSIVDRMRKRKVLQGEHVLYITPKLLHVRLWRDWWSHYRETLPLMTILPGLSESLGDWFIDMLIYAKGSPATEAVAKELLAPGGLFYKWDWLASKRGSELFFNLAQVDPRAALRSLTATLGSKSTEELRKFRDGRQQIVRALALLAIHRDSFLDAADLLLKLAEAETETYSNNASGTFASLFTLGWGRAATSGLPPAERLPMLLKNLRSPSSNVRKLILEAFDQALDISFTQWGVEEFHGLTKLPDRWKPQTYGDIHREYERYWVALRSALPQLENDEEKVHAANILVNHARELFKIEILRPTIVETLRDIHTNGPLQSGKILEAAVQIQHYDRKSYPPDIQTQIDDLVRELQGTGFAALLRRYVGLGLLEDKFNSNGELTEDGDNEVKALASEALAEPDRLRPELKWLVTDEAKNGYSFGVRLGTLDDSLSLWSEITANWKTARPKQHDFFVGGYLAGVFQRSPGAWERLILELAEDSSVQHDLPVLIWRSGMTDRISHLVTKLALSEAFPIETLRVFSYGGIVRRVESSDFADWIQALLEKDSWGAATAALELFDYRYMKIEGREKAQESMSEELALRVVTNPALFASRDSGRHDAMVDYHWGRIATKLLSTNVTMGIRVAHSILSNLEVRSGLLNLYRSEVAKFLAEVTRKAPEEMWSMVSELISPPMKSGAFVLSQWLRGGHGIGNDDDSGALLLMPRDSIWRWIDADAEKRAPVVAQFCPLQLTRTNGKPSLDLELLERYGHLKGVRSATSANYHSGSWWGPMSAHLESKKAQVEALMRTESNSNIRAWASDEIAGLERWIADERVREERERF